MRRLASLAFFINSLKINVSWPFLFWHAGHRMMNWLLVKNDTTHTIGAEFGSKVVTIGQQSIKLQIWDVRISTCWVRLSFFERSCWFRLRDKNDFDQWPEVIIVEHRVHCWSTTFPSRWSVKSWSVVIAFHFSRESYNAITNWLTDARTLASPNIVIILCGNKKDLEDQRQVTFLEGNRFAQEHGNVFRFSCTKTVDSDVIQFRLDVSWNVGIVEWKYQRKFPSVCTNYSEQNLIRSWSMTFAQECADRVSSISR